MQVLHTVIITIIVVLSCPGKIATLQFHDGQEDSPICRDCTHETNGKPTENPTNPAFLVDACGSGNIALISPLGWPQCISHDCRLDDINRIDAQPIREAANAACPEAHPGRQVVALAVVELMGILGAEELECAKVCAVPRDVANNGRE